MKKLKFTRNFREINSKCYHHIRRVRSGCMNNQSYKVINTSGNFLVNFLYFIFELLSFL